MIDKDCKYFGDRAWIAATIERMSRRGWLVDYEVSRLSTMNRITVRVAHTGLSYSRVVFRDDEVADVLFDLEWCIMLVDIRAQRRLEEAMVVGGDYSNAELRLLALYAGADPDAAVARRPSTRSPNMQEYPQRWRTRPPYRGAQTDSTAPWRPGIIGPADGA